MGTLAILFGSTGRLGRILAQTLFELEIESRVITRQVLKTFIHSGHFDNIPLSTRLLIADASVDYASIESLRQHEQDKQRLIRYLAINYPLMGVASFSSGVMDFDNSLITNPFYIAYKETKLANLAFFKSLDIPLFYPKIYTLIGPESYRVKSTGWVDVFEQASRLYHIEIGTPEDPRSWVSEETIRVIFERFLRGVISSYIDAPVNGVFRLSDIVEFFSQFRRLTLEIVPKVIRPWLLTHYIAPHPDCYYDDDLEAVLTRLLEHTINYPIE